MHLNLSIYHFRQHKINFCVIFCREDRISRQRFSPNLKQLNFTDPQFYKHVLKRSNIVNQLDFKYLLDFLFLSWLYVTIFKFLCCRKDFLCFIFIYTNCISLDEFINDWGDTKTNKSLNVIEQHDYIVINSKLN